MSDAIVSQPDTRFQTAFNRDSFTFAHQLHHHPFYDIDSLVELARRLGPQSAYWSTRAANVADGWEDADAQKQALEEAVAGVAHSNTLVVLKGIEQDAVFGPVFGRAVAEMAVQVGPELQTDLVHSRATLLISSPRRVTGYHIDAQANFLLQLRGSKTVHVFDGTDRSLVPEAELEAFHAGDLNAARYKAEQQGKARTVAFEPGMGVHVPIEWPHWVQNGDGVSVSISINYDLRSTVQRARVFRANRHLRRLGMSPAMPGGPVWRDMGKAALAQGLAKLAHRHA